MITMQINGVTYQTELEAVDVNVGGEWTSETIPVLQRTDVDAMMHDKNKYYMIEECISYAYINARATNGTVGEYEFSYQMLLNNHPATYEQIKEAIYG